MPPNPKVLPMSPVQVLPMSIVYTPFVKGGMGGIFNSAPMGSIAMLVEQRQPLVLFCPLSQRG